ncbi:hypothetical protein AAHT65_00005 (plasmid) [Bacillus atrophaeus]|uniref:hypothetical protein n=1 Tax=Bacillus atrophaeus TaxID=1452 RepID=UPI0031BA6524
MKKQLLYSSLATIIFIPTLGFFTDDSAKAAEVPIAHSEESGLTNSGTVTHNGTMYMYSVLEDDSIKKVTVSDGKEKQVAEYNKENDKLFLNGDQVDSEVQGFINQVAQEQQINTNDNSNSGYKYKKGSTIKGKFGFINATFASIFAILVASSVLKTFPAKAITGIASAIIGAISSSSFSVYWTRKTYTKVKGKYKRTGWQLRIYRDSKRKKLIHKEWASVGSGSI